MEGENITAIIDILLPNGELEPQEVNAYYCHDCKIFL